MNKATEINRGYLSYLRPPEASLEQARSLPTKFRAAIASLFSPIMPYVVLLAIMATSTLVRCYIRLCLWKKVTKLTSVHAGALDRLDLFLDQYPFHLYPLLAKSMELAFLQQQLPKVATAKTKIVELAIGDGSLSKQIYPPEAKITAVDISPFSLRFPAEMSHVGRSVISDCLAPAVASGRFDLLVTNNFLHHVSDKEGALDHIARIAERSIFNENSIYWASAWPKPFVLGRLGLRRKETQEVAAIQARFLQDLHSRSSLDKMVAERFEIEAEALFLCEKTYFLSNIFARLMGAYGPPTPGFMKRLAASSPFANRIRSVTRALAEALIRFDNEQDKTTAVFISYSCRSRTFQRTEAATDFICPDCGTGLASDLKCTNCGSDFPNLDGMTFLLPKELGFIFSNYQAQSQDFYEKESLQQHH